MADAAYNFLSFVRAGFAASLATADTFGAGQPALATAPVGVQVAGIADPVRHDAVVRGPGDVIGISPAQVVRTDPIDGAVGVEPNYFAHVVFDRPDLPWLFTPAAPSGERLRPWIVLVVVDLEGPHACTFESAAPLPKLHVPADASNQLPDLASSYLWAHAQVVTPGGETVRDALAPTADPRLSVSRLLCPRHLAPFTWYLAAVVPAFAVGREAGLGHDVTTEMERRLDPAWQPGAEVLLPVYYSWRFRTGEDADFEALARRLKGKPLPAGVGTRPMDVSRPGAGLPEAPAPASVDDRASIVWLDGALAPIRANPLHERDAAAAKAFATSLTVLLDRPAELLRGGDADPVVAPPIYGDKHALVVELGAGNPPPWLSELNLDPRTRVAAGLGTQVVQARQEDLVARAWRQLGDVLAANRLLRAAQLARGASLRVHGRLQELDPATLLSVSAPAHERIAGVAAAAVTLAKAVRDSRLPDATVEGAFRRLARPAATPARAAGAATLADAVVGRFAAEVFAAPVGGPDGVSSMRPASEVVGPARATAVLAGLQDAQPEEPGRLDVVLATLAENARPLPDGEALRASGQREDIGAVSVVSGFGAVAAEAVSAILGAAAGTQQPPAEPPHEPPPHQLPPVVTAPPHEPPVVVTHPHPPGHGHVPPVVTHPPGHVEGPPVVVGPHLPHGLTDLQSPHLRTVETAAARIPLGSVPFEPAGTPHQLAGDVVVSGGSVVIDSDVVGQIAGGDLHIAHLDDAQWLGLEQQAVVPRVLVEADPLTDPGSRLDVFRRDPDAISALAQVADGKLDATLTLDAAAATTVASSASRASLEGLATGSFSVALPEVSAAVTGPADLDARRELVLGAAGAFDRLVTVADAPPADAGPALDLAAARSGLLTRIDPERTVRARVFARVDLGAVRGIARRDDLDPVMACPQFLDPMWEGVRDLGGGWLLPGLELVPPDTATLVRTNPSFVAAHMVGLNHEFMRELLWREYPTDQRGTAFKRFWGRVGDPSDDIPAVHLFEGQLRDNLLAGQHGDSVLLLRSEILRRYPGSIVYLSRARVDGEELTLEGDPILPVFRGDLPPDVTFVGFPVPPEDLRAPGDPWWFVIAQPPSEPRFGLDDPTPKTPATPATANDLAWSHMAAAGAPTPFAVADPPPLQGHQVDGLTWGASAAVQAHLTYQHPVRVAIRALDLLPPDDGAPPQ